MYWISPPKKGRAIRLLALLAILSGAFLLIGCAGGVGGKPIKFAKVETKTVHFWFETPGEYRIANQKTEDVEGNNEFVLAESSANVCPGAIKVKPKELKACFAQVTCKKYEAGKPVAGRLLTEWEIVGKAEIRKTYSILET